MLLTCSRSWLPAALLLVLAGCSSDHPTASSPARPAPATSSPTQLPAAPALRQPVAPTRPLLAVVPTPAPEGQAAARPKQWVRWPVAAAQPGQNPAAPGMPASEASPGLAAGHPVASAPLTVQPAALGAVPAPADNDLPAFCAQAAPLRQIFEVRPGRDPVLLSQQGTRLVVPGRAFDVPATSGLVRLEVREFYTTADIILAGLSTRADTSLLETGGMLHLDAAADGQTVHMRAGMRILIQLPTQRQLPGMQLYEGVSADVSHAPNWQLAGAGTLTVNPGADPATLERWVALHPPKSPRWPRFDNDRVQLLAEFDRLLPDSKTDQARLRRRTPGKRERKQLQELSRLNHTAIRHAIALAVTLDSTGQLQRVAVVQGDSVLAAKILAAVRQLPAQHPASFVSRLAHHGRTSSSAQGTFSVLYTRSGKRLLGFNWVVMDKQLAEEIAKEGQRRRNEFARQFNKGSVPLTLGGGLYYELVAGGLGWINCDRLLEPGPRIEFAVQAPSPSTVVSLVFKGQRSILASSRTEGSTAIFEQVPDGAAATVVALRRENGITYLATTGLSLSQNVQPALQFHAVTLAELRTELARL